MKKQLSVKNKNRLIIAAIIILGIVLYFLIYVAPNLSTAFVDSYTAELGTLEETYEMDYCCIKSESTYTASNSGEVTRNLDKSTLTSAGATVVTVGGTAYAADRRGIINYSYDGLESEYTEDEMMNFDESKLHYSGDGDYSVKECPTDQAETGDVIYKIYDNKQWYMMSWVDKDTADKLREVSSVKIRIDDEEGTTIKCSLYYIDESPQEGTKKYRVIYGCNRFYDNLGALRFGTMEVITDTATGIIIETDSIEEVDGQQGVYVKNKYDEFVFTPVQIIKEMGDKTVVTNKLFYDEEGNAVETVQNYDSIKKGGVL